MQTIVRILLVISMLMTVVSCDKVPGPFPPATKEPVAITPEPAPVVKAPVKVEAKPIIYWNGHNWRLNKEGLRLAGSSHQVLVHYAGGGYDRYDMRDGKRKVEFGPWHDKEKIVAIGLYNPDTGRYAVSVRVQ